MCSTYLIYGLVDPVTHKLRYIGKSSSGFLRPQKHWRPSTLSKDNSHCGRWIKLLKEINLFPEIIIIQAFNNFNFSKLTYNQQNQELNEAEIFWINYYRKMNFDLTNMTDGGTRIKELNSGIICNTMGEMARFLNISNGSIIRSLKFNIQVCDNKYLFQRIEDDGLIN